MAPFANLHATVKLGNLWHMNAFIKCKHSKQHGKQLNIKQTYSDVKTFCGRSHALCEIMSPYSIVYNI